MSFFLMYSLCLWQVKRLIPKKKKNQYEKSKKHKKKKLPAVRLTPWKPGCSGMLTHLKRSIPDLRQHKIHLQPLTSHDYLAKQSKYFLSIEYTKTNNQESKRTKKRKIKDENGIEDRLKESSAVRVSRLLFHFNKFTHTSLQQINTYRPSMCLTIKTKILNLELIDTLFEIRMQYLWIWMIVRWELLARSIPNLNY